MPPPLPPPQEASGPAALRFLRSLRTLPPPPPGHKQLAGLLRLPVGPATPALTAAGLRALTWKPSSLGRRRKMTLVLDLDETLVHSCGGAADPVRLHGGVALRHDLELVIERRQPQPQPRAGATAAAAAGETPERQGPDVRGAPQSRTIYVWKRPYLELFLRECSKLFEVVIYTAGQRRCPAPTRSTPCSTCWLGGGLSVLVPEPHVPHSA